MNDRYIVGVIGAGNMGEALVKGLLRSQLVRPYEIIASARRLKRLKHLERTYGIHTTRKNGVVIEAAPTIILGVKPQNIDTVAYEICEHLNRQHLVISMLAGVDIAKLRKLLGHHPRLIRVMPNLPALIDEGVSAVFCEPRIPERSKRFAHQIFQAVGTTVDIHDEKLMDVITALSGTGPAYFFALMEAMQSAGEAMGLSKELSQQLTIQTALGSAAIAAQPHADPVQLRARVTSKKGTTWAAMNIFRKRQFWKLVADAIRAATHRARELRSLREK